MTDLRIVPPKPREFVVDEGPGYVVTADLATVACSMPDREDYDQDEPPEQFGAWRTESGRCDHAYCIEADYYARLYRNAPREATRDELDEMNADRELVLDETGGRGF